MLKSERVGSIIAAITAALLVALVVLAGLSERFSSFETSTKIGMATVETEDGSQTRLLPCSVGGLSPHGHASLRFKATVRPGDALCLHSVYTSYRVYAGGKLLATIGSGDDRPPRFMLDPPSEVRTISLDGMEGLVNFDIEMTTPASRDSLYLYRPLVGSEFSILFSLSSSYGIPMLLSIAFLFLGAGLVLLSLFFRSFNLRGRRLRYPGCIALASGLWQFSENALTVYLFQTPTVLYMCAFAGMFLVTVPIIQLTMISLDRQESPLLRGLLRGLQLAIMCAFALQLLGVLQLSQLSVPFSLALPAIIVVLSIYSIRTYLETRDVHMRSYAVAVSLLALGALLEMANYYLRVVSMVSLIFQLFLLAFVVVTSFEATRFMRHVYQESLRKLELDHDVRMLEQSIDAQRQRNDMVLAHEREVRRMRHDLRHHALYISTLVREGRYGELEAYVDELKHANTELARSPRTYCENVLANSLVSHYADLAEEKGYRFEARLDIPNDMANLSDSDLCVVVGNLLENAMEACARAEAARSDDADRGGADDGAPAISFKARTQGPLLFITLDNSLGPAPKKTEEGFATSKKGGSHGIGLQSIQAIAQKHGGEAAFSADGSMFHSSLYLMR